MADLITFSYQGDDGECLHRVSHSITPIGGDLLTRDHLKAAFLNFMRACTYKVDGKWFDEESE